MDYGFNFDDPAYVTYEDDDFVGPPAPVDYGFNFDDPAYVTYEDDDFVGPPVVQPDGTPVIQPDGTYVPNRDTLQFVETGKDELGNPTGYNINHSTGEVYDLDGNMLDPSTAKPITDSEFYENRLNEYYGNAGGILQNIFSTAKQLGTSAYNQVKGMVVNPDKSINWRNVSGIAGGIYGLAQNNRPQEKSGYQGGIPQYTAVRAAVPQGGGAPTPTQATPVTTPEGGVDFASSGAPKMGAVLREDGTNYMANYSPTQAAQTQRRPGSAGQRYFTDVQYAAPGEASAAARSAAAQQAQQLAQQQAEKEGKGFAAGGLTALAKGGTPRYLNGASDGMADKISARIDDGQEARLSHGEFVIPADVVGHLGNGNSEAGATRLYDMMERIRKARTGNPKQGKQINPNKFLPS